MLGKEIKRQGLRNVAACIPAGTGPVVGPFPEVEANEMQANIEEAATRILRTLRDSPAKSMTLLQLSAVSGMDSEALQEIVKQLGTKDLVRIAHPENLDEEIVTLRQQAFAVGLD